ncbi:hypothetical protein C9374_006488 [Naegleria lovaniensis]|uniref:Uncharacterized protein n=1 Tax=Naegleria lovaniensis TaxID=51637 RepID=A0AA88KH84_NAELO|nr:uncharacterized protein C9374_006488 [Naegleria lovaniensis]KAG2381499.1 hypothetical protein C9374_006488 [Naegleria lovaniensis]
MDLQHLLLSRFKRLLTPSSSCVERIFNDNPSSESGCIFSRPLFTIQATNLRVVMMTTTMHDPTVHEDVKQGLLDFGRDESPMKQSFEIPSSQWLTGSFPNINDRDNNKPAR